MVTIGSLPDTGYRSHPNPNGGNRPSKISASPDMEGQSLEAAGFSTARDKYGAAVIAIKRGREPILAPSKDEEIKQGDVLVVAGREDVLEKVRPA